MLKQAGGLTALVETLQHDLSLTPARIRAGPATSGVGYEVVVGYVEADPILLAECASTIAGLDAVSGANIDTTA